LYDRSYGNNYYISLSISLPFQDCVFPKVPNTVAMSKSRSKEMIQVCGVTVIRCGYKSHLKTEKLFKTEEKKKQKTHQI